jgi:hypothetical protein
LPCLYLRMASPIIFWDFGLYFVIFTSILPNLSEFVTVNI